MEAFMFMSRNQSPGDISCQDTLPSRQVIVEGCKPTANAISEGNDRVERRPVFVFLWDLRMVLAMIPSE